jgi:hypothetical protein
MLKFDFAAFDFQGDIAEIIVYKNVLPQTERDKVTCYLSKKYNITVTTVCD